MNAVEPIVTEIDYRPATVLPPFRWTVCGLLFFATTINYMDRQILGLLAPMLKQEIGWNDAQYGHIVAAFQAAYAIGLFSVGRLIDRIGTKRGYAIAIIIWSLAAAGHALARSASAFGVARFALGIGEAGNFPAAIKTVAEWFPKRERAFATGLFNSGSNVGAIIAPLIVPPIAMYFGWRGAFVIIGITGFVWLAAWLLMYRRPEDSRFVTSEQLALLQEEVIDAEPVERITKTVSWLDLPFHSQTWAFCLQAMCVQPVWWFYLYWLPDFFHQRYGLTLSKSGGLLAIIYSLSLIGSIGGGALPGLFLTRDFSLNVSRKVPLLMCVLLAVPMTLVAKIDNPWVATFVIGLAAAGLQCWSANTYTMVSDLFPKRAVATVVGLGSACGSATALIFAEIVGKTLQSTHSYNIPFFIAGLSLPLAWTMIHLFSPRWEAARL